MSDNENLSKEQYREIIAFANVEGGTVFVGISKTGQIVPFKDENKVFTDITKSIRDIISPDVTIFVKFMIEKDGAIRIEIGEGSYKPYFLKSKVNKSSGEYIRPSASTVPVLDQVRQLFKSSHGDTYEELRSENQELSFRTCSEVFHEQDVEFDEKNYAEYGIRNCYHGLYTNLGYLLSDECTHKVKIAVFSDEENTITQDSKEFTGSVLKQLEDAYTYLSLINRKRSVIDGLTRKNYWDYPGFALREALINALIHRDYSYNDSIIINVNSKGMEFISVGGLVPGLLLEDVRNGVSMLRNSNLASIFNRLNLIEAYGTGIRRIFALYKDCPIKPGISVSKNSFKITLPNTGFYRERPEINITLQMQMVLNCINNNPEISDLELQKILQIKRTRFYTLIGQMSDIGIISIRGRGKNKRYLIS